MRSKLNAGITRKACNRNPSNRTLGDKLSRKKLIIESTNCQKHQKEGSLDCWCGRGSVPWGDLGILLWVSHTLAEGNINSDWAWMGWRKATVGKGTDWTRVIEESDRELGTPAWRLLEGILHRGKGEGDTSSLEEPGTLGGLRDCSGVDEDLGRRCRMEEKKEQDSGRGMVPIPLSNVRILQPKPAAQEEQLKWLRKEGRRGGTSGREQQDDHGWSGATIVFRNLPTLPSVSSF